LGKKISASIKQLNEQANEEIKRQVKSEMALNGVTINIVAERLTAMGRPISEQGLRNALSNGTHKTTWYWDLMKAIKQ
jgi:hypothetical protein